MSPAYDHDLHGNRQYPLCQVCAMVRPLVEEVQRLNGSRFNGLSVIHAFPTAEPLNREPWNPLALQIVPPAPTNRPVFASAHQIALLRRSFQSGPDTSLAVRRGIIHPADQAIEMLGRIRP